MLANKCIDNFSFIFRRKFINLPTSIKSTGLFFSEFLHSSLRVIQKNSHCLKCVLDCFYCDPES